MLPKKCYKNITEALIQDIHIRKLHLQISEFCIFCTEGFRCARSHCAEISSFCVSPVEDFCGRLFLTVLPCCPARIQLYDIDDPEDDENPEENYEDPAQAEAHSEPVIAVHHMPAVHSIPGV